MTLGHALLLGLVEGVTEFLPISSTGHLILVSHWLRAHSNGVFEIVIQLGAVLAVLWFYRRDVGARVRSAWSGENGGRRFWVNLAIAAAPVVALGLAFERLIESRLFAPTVVGVALAAGGIVLWWADARARPHVTDERGLDAITPRQALIVGLTQAAALVPGVSRSGASIVGGLVAGLDRRTATAFSFYLALPTLGGATLYKLAKSLRGLLAANQGWMLLVSTAAAFITAVFVIGWLLRSVARSDFRPFALYRVALGIVVIVVMVA